MNGFENRHLSAAINLARVSREKGNHPFGAVLVDDQDRIVLTAENTVNTTRDITGHAETNLVRLASQKYPPEDLAKFTLYASTEPCAMCAGAIYWSGIGRVVFALSEADLYDIIGPSPEHLQLPCREVFARSQRSVRVTGPVAELNSEARAVHKDFWTL